MPLFSSKEAFLTLGLSPLPPSLHHRSENCTICTLPLAMPPSLLAAPPATTSEAGSNRPPHPATRINGCNHIVGRECLLAWVEISCICPVCNCRLFDATDEDMTERDVVFVYRKLRWLWRKREILAAIERVAWRRRCEGRARGVDPVEEEDGDEGMEEEASEEGEIVEREADEETGRRQ